MIATKDGEEAPRQHGHRRIFVAAMASVIINSILLIASFAASFGHQHSMVARIVNVMTLPSALVVGKVFVNGGHNLSTFLLPLLTIMLCCFAFYMGVSWLVLAAVARVRQALERP